MIRIKFFFFIKQPPSEGKREEPVHLHRGLRLTACICAGVLFGSRVLVVTRLYLVSRVLSCVRGSPPHLSRLRSTRPWAPNGVPHCVQLRLPLHPPYNQQGVEWATPSSLSGEGDKATALTAIERVHTREYLDEVKRICAKGGGGADFDT